MPPCAAMLCARRGESWKQKHLTLYPSSLRLAAAAPPASPEPTTITVYFRLFAGFTSFISNLCLLHFSTSGPEGVFDRRSIASLPDDAGDDAERNEREAEPDDERHTEREVSAKGVYRRLRVAERTHRAPGAVVQVQAQKYHRDHVERRDPPDVEARHDVAVDVFV